MVSTLAVSRAVSWPVLTPLFNNERTHQGKRCQGRTPMTTFLDGLELFREKNLAEKLAA